MQKNPEAPIFMFFIDCMFQLLTQFPFSFEYNTKFLKSTLDACYSCKYGTFLCNSDQERTENKLKNKTVSFWTYVNSNRDCFTNPLYQRTNGVLYPSSNIKDLVLWDEYFQRSWLRDGTSQNKNDFQQAAITIIQAKNTRIKELEKELLKYRPDLFSTSQNTKEMVVKSIIDEVMRRTFVILNTHKFEVKLHQHKLKSLGNHFSFDQVQLIGAPVKSQEKVQHVLTKESDSPPVVITYKKAQSNSFDINMKHSSPKLIKNQKKHGKFNCY